MEHLRLPETISKVLVRPLPASVVSTELVGSTECPCETYSVSTSAQAQVLDMCRELLSAGCSPNQATEIYRAPALAVRVRSNGKAAKLAVEESEHGGPP